MSRAQPSIMSFFQPRQQQAPRYVPSPAPQPPAAAKAAEVAAAAAAAASSAPATQPYGSQPPITTAPAAAAAAVVTTPSPHPQASIAPIAEHHIPALRRINSLLLPVAYPDAFYHRALDPAASGLFSRAILWRDDPTQPAQLVGGLVCRLEPAAVYIQSLALLSPYRGLGLAAAALDDVLASAAAAAAALDVRTVYAHVWTDNEDGLRWYAARGFVREGSEPVQGYYFKLRPDTAWIVRRDLRSSATSATATTAARPILQPVQNSTTAAAINLPSMTTISTTTTSGNGPPPPRKPSIPSSRPSPSPSPAPSLSFQKVRPETEWNDLPAHMVVPSGPSTRSNSTTNLQPPPAIGCPPGGGGGSGASSRSSSAARKKKDRAYPAAAFGQ